MQLRLYQDSTGWREEPSGGSLKSRLRKHWPQSNPVSELSSASYSFPVDKAGPTHIFVTNFDTAQRDWDSFWVGTRASAKPSPPAISKHDFGWVFDAARSTDVNGASKLPFVIDGVNSLIASKSFGMLDRVIQVIPVETASRHILLGIARATFPVRSKLNAWQQFVLQVKDEFANRGLNADGLLKGLL